MSALRLLPPLLVFAVLAGLVAVPVAAKLMPQLLTAQTFEHKVTRTPRWFVQFHDPECDVCKTMTPKFRKVARKLLNNNDVQFGKFNCAAQYNEAFCDNHGILEKPTYILFDEYHTTGHRYNPPYVPTEKQMKLWIVDMLYTSNATRSFDPKLRIDMNMETEWRHPAEWTPPEQGGWEFEEVDQRAGTDGEAPSQQAQPVEVGVASDGAAVTEL